MSKKILKWTARIASTLFAAYWLVMLLGHALTGDEPITYEGFIIGILGFTLIVGTLIAWFRELTGGIILIVGGLMFSVFAFFTAGRNEIFIVPGVLFVLSRRVGLSSKRSK